MAGLNVLVFIFITYLAHREKLQEKRNNQLESVLVTTESTDSVDAKKQVVIKDEEKDVTHVAKE